MKVIRNTITISAPADTVFMFVADPSTAPLRMPPHLQDRYHATAPLAEGDTRETTYELLGIHWQERRWVVRIDTDQRRVVWHTDSRFNLREEWRVEALDAGRCRLVLERQLAPMTFGESVYWRFVIAPLMNAALDHRLRMTRDAIEGGWSGHRLRTA